MFNRRSLVAATGILLLLVSFQNCAQNGAFSSDDTEDTYSSISAASNAPPNGNSASGIPTSGSAPAGSPLFTGLPKSPVSGTPSSTTQPSTSTSTTVTALGCSYYADVLKWNSNEEFKVDLTPLDLASTNGAAEVPSYSGFSVTFSSPQMGGKVFSTGREFQVAATGFTIRIESQEGSVEIPNSAYVNPDSVLAKVQGGISSWNDNGKTGSKANFFVNRDYFFSHLSRFRSAKISLYCDKRLVASGTQDVQSIYVDMNKSLIKQANGTYTSKDPNTGFINISCPLETKVGATFQCTGGGTSIVSGYWLINGKEDRSFDDQSTYVMRNALPGNHTFQRIVKYKSGVEDRSELFLVKVR